MEQLKTILKFHFRSAKVAYKMFAVSAEVFCRHSFGQRYALTLLASLLGNYVFLGVLLQPVVRQQHSALIDDYLLIFFVLVIYHICSMWRRRANIQSYSNGQSWDFWRRLNVNPNLVKTTLEPLMVLLIGALLFSANNLLSIWLQLAGVCLFIKEFLANLEFGNRVLDSVDARLEGERIGTGVRQHTTPQAAGGQQVNPVLPVEPEPAPVSSIEQIYTRLEPALQRLMGSPNQDSPNTSAANRRAAPQNTRRYHAGPLGTLPRMTFKRPQPKNKN